MNCCEHCIQSGALARLIRLPVTVVSNYPSEEFVLASTDLQVKKLVSEATCLSQSAACSHLSKSACALQLHVRDQLNFFFDLDMLAR
jgi:hypothetical protein